MLIMNKFLLCFFIMFILFFPTQALSYLSPGINSGDTQHPDPQAPFSFPDEKLVASGNGFEVFGKDVRQFREFMHKTTPIVTTDHEFTRMLSSMLAAALEAKKIGIVTFEDNVGSLSFERLIEIRNDHSEHLLQDLSLSDAVIESYYHAFPEKFLVKTTEQENTGPAENIEADSEYNQHETTALPCPRYSQDQLQPLNHALRDYISNLILGPKRSNLLRQENDRLLEEYDVEIYI